MQTQTTPAPPSRLLRLPSVLERVPHSKTTLYRLIKEGKFKAPIRLGVNSVAWLESDVEAYIQTLAKASSK
jgi:prophage regulatory protein